MLKLKALALATMSIAGCTTAPSEPPRVVCPHEVAYSKELQAEAAGELAALPKDGIIRGRFMPDYGRLRDQARACRGEK